MSKLKKLGKITVLTQVMNVIPFVIITFIFDKELYGEFARIMSVASVLGISAVLKLDIYNLDKKYGFHYLDVLPYLFPLWILYFLVLIYYDFNFIVSLLIIISIGIYDFSANSLLQLNQVGKFNQLRLLRVSTSILGYMFLWLFGVTLVGLLVIELLSRVIPILITCRRFYSKQSFKFIDALECFRITVGWSINNSVVLLIPFIMGMNIDLVEVGWYFVFYKGINQVEILFASTVNQYIVSLSDREILNDYLRKLLLYAGMFTASIAVSCVLLVIIIDHFFNFYSNLFWFAGCVILASGLGSPFYVILNIIGKSKFQFTWDVFRFLTFGALVLISAAKGFQYFLVGLPLILLLSYLWLHFEIYKHFRLKSF